MLPAGPVASQPVSAAVSTPTCEGRARPQACPHLSRRHARIAAPDSAKATSDTKMRHF